MYIQPDCDCFRHRALGNQTPFAGTQAPDADKPNSYPRCGRQMPEHLASCTLSGNSMPTPMNRPRKMWINWTMADMQKTSRGIVYSHLGRMETPKGLRYTTRWRLTNCQTESMPSNGAVQYASPNAFAWAGASCHHCKAMSATTKNFAIDAKRANLCLCGRLLAEMRPVAHGPRWPASNHLF